MVAKQVLLCLAYHLLLRLSRKQNISTWANEVKCKYLSVSVMQKVAIEY
jgi:hypothetical protein